MEKRSEAVERALSYPYATPERSFVQLGAETLDLGEVDFDFDSRTPVLAYGANAAPAVLARKLGATGDPVPALRARLDDLDVVYSAHISPYGSIPAAIRASAGARATAFVVYLTAPQLDLMSRTEPNYVLAALPAGACRLEDGPPPIGLLAYLTRRGRLLVEGSEVALAEVDAPGRSLPAMAQRQVLDHVRSLLCPELTLERFVAAVSSDPARARSWAERLASTSADWLRLP